jgi:hypothetical protein
MRKYVQQQDYTGTISVVARQLRKYSSDNPVASRAVK